MYLENSQVRRSDLPTELIALVVLDYKNKFEPEHDKPTK